MIHFQLRCRPAGHAYDGWFRSNDDFERQAEAGFVECPVCGASAVEKALMRPAIARGGAALAAAEARAEIEGSAGAVSAAAPDAAGEGAAAMAGPAMTGPGSMPAPAGPPAGPRSLAHVPAPSPEVAKAFAVLQEISRKVRAEADYVGDTFAEEARRIHYGESDVRRIYGEASKKEVESLQEEGITALPLMPLPEDGQ